VQVHAATQYSEILPPGSWKDAEYHPGQVPCFIVV
jgi:hypothetical protein